MPADNELDQFVDWCRSVVIETAEEREEDREQILLYKFEEKYPNFYPKPTIDSSTNQLYPVTLEQCIGNYQQHLSKEYERYEAIEAVKAILQTGIDFCCKGYEQFLIDVKRSNLFESDKEGSSENIQQFFFEILKGCSFKEERAKVLSRKITNANKDKIGGFDDLLGSFDGSEQEQKQKFQILCYSLHQELYVWDSLFLIQIDSADDEIISLGFCPDSRKVTFNDGVAILESTSKVAISGNKYNVTSQIPSLFNISSKYDINLTNGSVTIHPIIVSRDEKEIKEQLSLQSQQACKAYLERLKNDGHITLLAKEKGEEIQKQEAYEQDKAGLKAATTQLCELEVQKKLIEITIVPKSFSDSLGYWTRKAINTFSCHPDERATEEMMVKAIGVLEQTENSDSISTEELNKCGFFVNLSEYSIKNDQMVPQSFDKKTIIQAINNSLEQDLKKSTTVDLKEHKQKVQSEIEDSKISTRVGIGIFSGR